MEIAANLTFWLSLALLFYTYAGYPLLMCALARLRPKAVLRKANPATVSIIIAVREGEDWIERKLNSCLCQDYPADLLEIIVVSDGSRDRTADIVAQAQSPRVRIIELRKPKGKPAALDAGVRDASGEILIFTDVRQQLDKDAVRQLVMNFADPRIGAVSGELLLDSANGDGFGEGIDLYWRYEKWLRSNEARYGSSIGVTGALYALRRECYRPIPAETLLDDLLIPMNVVDQGLRVIFDSRAIAHDIASSARERERRRKVRTIAGNYQLLHLKPRLANPFRNPLWWQYVSHKLLRLWVPLFLVAILASNVLLLDTSPFYPAALAAQLTLYGLAVIGIVLPRVQRHRLMRIPATFLTLNWFAVLGFLHFARYWNRGVRW